MDQDPDLEAAPARIEDRFDAVVFLTHSDWKTEPRSNRYHYATRFARRLPVYFVQPDAEPGAPTPEDSGVAALTLVHAGWQDEEMRGWPTLLHGFRGTSVHVNHALSAAQQLKAYLDDQGVRRPLFWFYNLNYSPLADLYPDSLRIYHATEDYTLPAGSLRFFDDAYQALVFDKLADCDLLLAVSDNVRENYVQRAGFAGRAVTLPNGCDFEFWLSSGAFEGPRKGPAGLARLFKAPPRPQILYQGGINSRLDYDLLNALAARMDDCEFVFCGRVDANQSRRAEMAGWEVLRARPNVRYAGEVTPQGIAELARDASAAIIPFRASPLIAVSLPLKAYEYLACGLPVTTTPINALEGQPALFAFAGTAEAFERELRRQIPTRTDAGAVAMRLDAARAMDYGRRFTELEAVIAQTSRTPRLIIPARAQAPGALLHRWEPGALEVQPAWSEDGASLEARDTGDMITTPGTPWNFAASLALDGPPCRLTVEIGAVAGVVLMSIYDLASGDITRETQLVPGPGPSRYEAELPQGAGGRLLLFRNGDGAGGGYALFVCAESHALDPG